MFPKGVGQLPRRGAQRAVILLGSMLPLMLPPPAMLMIEMVSRTLPVCYPDALMMLTFSKDMGTATTGSTSLPHLLTDPFLIELSVHMLTAS